MGHASEILKFKESDYTRTQIQSKCDDWGNRHADIEERSGQLLGLGKPIQFTNMIFDTEDKAEDYLDKTFGNYRQTAVRYKQAKGSKTSTKVISDLERRISEYQRKLSDLNTPYHINTKSKTIRCKTCGAVLPTAYCGRSYKNNCPVCNMELRPNGVLEREDKYRQTLLDLNQRLKEEQYKQKQREMNSFGYDLYWAVACEVHC